jgi:uracil-DNA glycosylase
MLQKDNGWYSFFNDEKVKKEVKTISKQLSIIKETIYPHIYDVFRPFELLEPKDINVVIIGQDPYFNGEAEGMAFSIKTGYKVAPSLKNIFKGLKKCGFTIKDESNGSLYKWMSRGVFLINTALTVLKGKANIHKDLWKNFTILLMNFINNNCSKGVILMWGRQAEGYSKYLSKHEHVISSHPSPLAGNGFENSDCFNKANKKLKELGKKPINWSL